MYYNIYKSNTRTPHHHLPSSIIEHSAVQRPFFEEITEESLENFVNKYVKRLGLWSDTTIHHEPSKQWMVCIGFYLV